MPELSQFEKDGVVYDLKDQYLRSGWEVILPEQTVDIPETVTSVSFDLPEQKYDDYLVCFQFAQNANITAAQSMHIAVNGLNVVYYGLSVTFSSVSRWVYCQADVSHGFVDTWFGHNAKSYGQVAVNRSNLRSDSTGFVDNDYDVAHGREYALKISFTGTGYSGSVRVAVLAKHPIN